MFDDKDMEKNVTPFDEIDSELTVDTGVSDKKKKDLVKIRKKLIATLVAACVAIVAVIGVLIYFNINSGNIGVENGKSIVVSKFLVACMPKSCDIDDNGKKVTIYMEFNENYDPQKDEPLKAYMPYYYDDNGKRIDLPTGVYISPSNPDDQNFVTIGFVALARQNIEKYAIPVKIAIALFALAIIAIIISLAFVSYVIKEENKKKGIVKEKKKIKNKK